jgi:hypothetical protein
MLISKEQPLLVYKYGGAQRITHASADSLSWDFKDIKASGCYELARNWCLLKALAGDRPATLVNLGLAKAAQGARRPRKVQQPQKSVLFCS